MNEGDKSATHDTGFRPTRLHFIGVLTAALLGFLIPQKTPLRWFPLNNLGDNFHYLEITCKTDGDGSIRIYPNFNRGINEQDTLSWPIAATIEPYTYTFPLPDAPIVELRLDPPAGGVELQIRQMRIVDRRGLEIRRFTRDMFAPLNQIAEISPTLDGWRIVSTVDSIDPILNIHLTSPIVPPEGNRRNLIRCMYSTSYLASMLWLFSTAVLLPFHRQKNGKALASLLLFTGVIASAGALVGNRGLLNNSWHTFRYTSPPISDKLHLELDLASNQPSPLQLFYDTGAGFNEEESQRTEYEPHSGLQTIRFSLPPNLLLGLRLDPRDNQGTTVIRGMRVIDGGGRTRLILRGDSLDPVNEIESLIIQRGSVLVATIPSAQDPILTFTPSSVELINSVVVDSRHSSP